MERSEIIKELCVTALDDPETGWLSDLASKGLEWDEFNEVIMMRDMGGSIDIGHLAEIVEILIEKALEAR